MQRLEVSGVVRLIYRSLGVKGLNTNGTVYKPKSPLLYALQHTFTYFPT